MTANADRNVCIHNAKPFEDETDGKEHSESQNELSARELICTTRCKQNPRSGLCFQFIWFHVSHGFLSRQSQWYGRNEKLAERLTLYSVLQLEASSPFENYTLRKLSPCLSALECKHTKSTNNCREKQRLLSIGRDAEEILNSYIPNCKYKLLNGTRTT